MAQTIADDRLRRKLQVSSVFPIILDARVLGSDAVDGSSTGTRVPSMWVLLGRL
jgi:hypothetical protein